MVFSTLKGVTSSSKYQNGTIDSCMLAEKNIVSTACGDLIPQFEDENVRRKHIPSISFYPDGSVQKLSLNEQTLVQTPLGELPAEFVTFYQSGALCRVFPCNGQISGYWTEQDEAELCPVLTLKLPTGPFKAKVISLHFYESGALRSITLWPGQQIVLRNQGSLLPTRIGFSLYEDGTIESVEPPEPLLVSTPIGVLHAFDPRAIGIHADHNSLSFYPDGALRTVVTESDQVELIYGGDTPSVFMKPLHKPNPLDEEMTITLPLRVTFQLDGRVRLDNAEQEEIVDPATVCFRVLTGQGNSTAMPQSTSSCGGDCSSCSICG